MDTEPNVTRVPSKWPWLLGFALLLAALVLALWGRGEGAATLVGRPAPGFALPLAQHLGTLRSPQDSHGRPLLLHFWAPSCAPCVAELPAWQALHERSPRAGFDVLTVSADEPSAVRDFLTARQLTLPVVLDATARVHIAYGVETLPATVAIDASGRVRQVLFGVHPAAVYEAAVKSL